MKTLAKTLYSKSLPAMAWCYRRQQTAASRSLLRLVGIADPGYRSDFYTLAKIVDSIERFEDCAIIECGVYKGSTLLGMAHRLTLRGVSNVSLLGCDSFEGFPEPAAEDSLSDGTLHSHARKGFFDDTNIHRLTDKIEMLGYAGKVRLVKGFFEQTLPELGRMRFSLAHLDCDLYQSYLTCLNFLYPRMVPGGYMVFDEYDFSADVFPGAQKAIDGFFQGKREKIERLPEAKNPRYFIRKL
jgi:O-methyltransferase